MIALLKKLVKKIIRIAGFNLVPVNSPSYSEDGFEAAFVRLKRNGINPALIVDVGAAKGTWSLSAFRHWPSAIFLLVEPLSEHKDILDKLTSEYSNFKYCLGVAGENSGETFLNVSPDLDGSGVYGQGSNGRRVPVMPLNDIAKDYEGRVIIKLDTHGYELPILTGATDLLKRTDALIIEVYGFKISPTCLLFHELTAYLDKVGFRLGDIVEVARRPGDKLFWQADAVYYRKDHPAFRFEDYN